MENEKKKLKSRNDLGFVIFLLIISLLMFLLVPYIAGWTDTSYAYRQDIINETETNLGLVVNYSIGFCDYNIWTNPARGNISVYYNNCSNFTILNLTDEVPYEIERTREGRDIADVYSAKHVYHFGNDSALAGDSTGRTNGTINSTVNYNATGKIGSSAFFDGGFISIPINIVGSVSFWTYGTNFAASQYFLDARADGGAGYFYVNYPSHELTNSSGTIYVNGSTTGINWSSGCWVFLTVTGITLTGSPTDIKIGSQNNGVEDFFYGHIDELRFWNRTLNATEVETLYYNSLAAYNMKLETEEEYQNTAPTMDGITESTDPILEQTTQEITPTNPADTESSDLHIYCLQSTSDAGTPTTANTCDNDQAWSSPYTGIHCNLTTADVAANTTYYARCRLYDGANYSLVNSTSYLVEVVGVETYLVSPANNTITNQSDQTFVCNATSFGALQLENITLYIWNNSDEYYVNSTEISGVFNETNWTKSLVDQDYEWNCYANDSTKAYSEWANHNYSITIDTINPLVTAYSPTGLTQRYNVYATNNMSIDLNYSINDINLVSCWYSLNEGTNTTLASCANSSVNLGSGYYNLTIYANDTAGNLGSNTTSFPAISFA